jgi:hypothetical protein
VSDDIASLRKDDIESLLRFDAIAEAEKITGKSYKYDGGTAHLGFALSMAGNDLKRQALESSDDTHYGMTYDDALRIYASEGFQVIYSRYFRGRYFSEEKDPLETFRVLWHPDGILATAESYKGKTLNSSKIYYNIEFAADLEGDGYWNYISSGSLDQPAYAEGRHLWVGDHDVREGLRHKLATLRSVGKFQEKWVSRPFLWFLTYTDTDVPDYDYKAMNAAVIATFPEHVRTAITPEEN